MLTGYEAHSSALGVIATKTWEAPNVPTLVCGTVPPHEDGLRGWKARSYTNDDTHEQDAATYFILIHRVGSF